jgi:hypothetical protein
MVRNLRNKFQFIKGKRVPVSKFRVQVSEVQRFRGSGARRFQDNPER